MFVCPIGGCGVLIEGETTEKLNVHFQRERKVSVSYIDLNLVTVSRYKIVPKWAVSQGCMIRYDNSF